MTLKVRLTHDKGIGIGLEAVDKLPKNMKIAYYNGTIISTTKAKTLNKEQCTHFLTVPGTGCTIDGTFKNLFPGHSFPDF